MKCQGGSSFVDVRSTKLARRGEASATCRGVVSGPRATVLGKKHVELFLFCTIARVLFYECSPYHRMSAMICRLDNAGNPPQQSLGHVGDMSADMSPTCWPENVCCVVWTLFPTQKMPTYPAKVMAMSSLGDCGSSSIVDGGERFCTLNK